MRKFDTLEVPLLCFLRNPAVCALLALAALTIPACAETVYTSAADFDAATSGLTTLDFGGIAAPRSFVNEGFDFSIGGVTFVSSNYLNVNSPNYYSVSNPVAIDAGGLFGPVSIPITLSDGFTTVLTAPDSITGTGALDFIGFTSSAPVTSLTLDFPAGPYYGALGEVSFEPAATPEPSSFALLLTGLTGAAAAARRRLTLSALSSR
jgi:hypothetical protein